MRKRPAPFTEEHRKNMSLSRKGKKKPPRSLEHRRKLSEYSKSRVGEKAAHWLGDKVGYHGVHIWVRKWKGSPKKCEVCGTIDKNKVYDWINIDHTYKRILDDYVRMCRSCHRNYDKNRGAKIN